MVIEKKPESNIKTKEPEQVEVYECLGRSILDNRNVKRS